LLIHVSKGTPRGASAPLSLSSPSPLQERDTKRRVQERRSLSYILFPLPLIKGKGDKGGWGLQIKIKGVRMISRLKDNLL